MNKSIGCRIIDRGEIVVQCIHKPLRTGDQVLRTKHWSIEDFRVECCWVNQHGIRLANSAYQIFPELHCLVNNRVSKHFHECGPCLVWYQSNTPNVETYKSVKKIWSSGKEVFG